MDPQQTFDHFTETLRVAWTRLANAREAGGDISEFQRTVQDAEADRLMAFSEWLDELGGELPLQPVAGGRDVGPLDAVLRQRGGQVLLAGIGERGTEPLASFPKGDPASALECWDAVRDWNAGATDVPIRYEI